MMPTPRPLLLAATLTAATLWSAGALAQAPDAPGAAPTAETTPAAAPTVEATPKPKPAEETSPEARPDANAQPVPAEKLQVETAPADAKPADAKPADAKPADAKPADAKKDGDKPAADTQPEEEDEGVLLIEEADVLNEEALKEGLWLRASVVTEVGFVGVLSHKIQMSKDGTYFDYRGDGGQDTLTPFYRLSVELEFNARHRLILLYNPLELEGQTTLTQDTRFDGLTFPRETPLNSRYNFPFYRLSYLYDLSKSQRHELSIGATIQVRNATITFTSADGRLRRSSRDVGLVPALKLRGRYTFDNGLFLGGEADGIYAPVSGLNGSDEKITGAIADVSARGGLMLTDKIDTFLNVRYLGGGAVGTNDDDVRFGDGYVKNWFHTMSITLGFIYIL